MRPGSSTGTSSHPVPEKKSEVSEVRDQPTVPKAPTPASAIAFLRLCSKLKTTKRTGWVDHGIPDAESISDHMHRMAVMALLLPQYRRRRPHTRPKQQEHVGNDNGSDDDDRAYVAQDDMEDDSEQDAQVIDRSRCVQMAVVHDLAEAIVGDLTPHCGIPKSEKHRMELEAMQQMIDTLGPDTDGAKQIMELWAEYEEGVTPEARFVKDVDKVEMLCQAKEYEDEHGCRLDSFFTSTAGKIRHPMVKSWADELYQSRPLASDIEEERQIATIMSTVTAADADQNSIKKRTRSSGSPSREAIMPVDKKLKTEPRRSPHK